MALSKESASRAHSRARSSATKDARLAARLTPEQKMILSRAAALAHQPVSQFVVNSAMQAAEETIRQYEIVALSARDSLAVMDALLNPAPASQKLHRVAERYREFMNENE